MEEEAVIPTLHIRAKNIPEAHYKATRAVFEKGMTIRTQYDRMEKGEYIDPPSRDAKVLIEISNPFNQPRYPSISFSELGTYIAEFMGVKDHLVIPLAELKRGIKESNLDTKWPYTYHQRIFAYPLADGTTFNQMTPALERLAKDSISRRALVITALPEVDCYLKEDIPCLREIHLRCTEADPRTLVLHMDAKWRSRDLMKAWHDNVVGITYLQRDLAKTLGEMTGKRVLVGSYSDYSSSLHIYGQDAKLAENFLKKTEEEVVETARGIQGNMEGVVISQVEGLLTPELIAQWKFGKPQISLIRAIADDLKASRDA